MNFDVVTIASTKAYPVQEIEAQLLERELEDARTLPTDTIAERKHREQAMRIAEGKRAACYAYGRDKE